jgi:hypothetical protein
MTTRSVAYAVVREESPLVLLADDVDILQRVIATRVVAQTDGSQIAPDLLENLQRSLLDEQWGDAVSQWIEYTGVPIDVYTHIEIWSEDMLPVDLTNLELRTTPLFRANA